MSVQEILMDDFSGGVQVGTDPGEFSDRQWSRLDGLVFDGDERRLRSQWARHVLRDTASDAVDLGEVDGVLVLLREEFSARYRAVPALGSDPGATAWDTAGLTSGPARVLSKVPERDSGSGGWREGLLLNTVESDGNAWVLTADGSGGVDVRELTDRYPTDGSQEDAMPHGNVATMWGDFLVLGDIRWTLDDSSAISEENSARYPHYLWYSQPGRIDRWDPIDVEPVGNRSGSNRIVGLFPIDIGMVVVSTDSVDLLRGNAAESVPEPLRPDVGCPSSEACAYWPHVNAVVWVDGDGFVWHTNGEGVDRLDRPLPGLEGEGLAVTPWGDRLLVRRGDRLWVFQAFAEDGAWTRVLVDDLPSRMLAADGALYALGDAGSVWRFDPQHDGGRAAGVTPLVETRTVGDPHRRIFWHRVGVRWRGSGEPTVARSKAGRGVASYEVPLEVSGSQAVVRAHGPSYEASFEVEFDGDVTVESVSVWAHEGRGER